MNLNTKLGWAAFLVTLSALGMSPAQAAIKTTVAHQEQSTASIESRLEKIVSVLKTNESQLPETSNSPDSNDVARAAWGNGNGRAAWRNGNNWRNNGWHNGNNWRNGGGWHNNHWHNGGGGGWINRR